jgi:hypothetical protein
VPEPEPVVVAPVPEPVVVAPEPVAVAPDPVPVVVAPEPPKPRPAKSAWATTADVAAYVSANPDWRPGGPIAKGAGSGYLPGWTPSGPPSGAPLDGPASGVTAELARRVCGSLGRSLLPFAEPPEASGRLEYRLDGDVVVIRDGETRIPAGTDAKRSVRFRCRK